MTIYFKEWCEKAPAWRIIMKNIQWRFKDEILYCEAEECLRKLSEKYNIGVIANQKLSTEMTEILEIV